MFGNIEQKVKKEIEKVKVYVDKRFAKLEKQNEEILKLLKEGKNENSKRQ